MDMTSYGYNEKNSPVPWIKFRNNQVLLYKNTSVQSYTYQTG